MPDLLRPDDWDSCSPDLNRDSRNPECAWRVDAAKQEVEHLITPAHEFATITFADRLINGEFSARVTVDREKFQNPDDAPECCGHLVFRYLSPDRYYAFGIGGCLRRLPLAKR